MRAGLLWALALAALVAALVAGTAAPAAGEVAAVAAAGHEGLLERVYDTAATGSLAKGEDADEADAGDDDGEEDDGEEAPDAGAVAAAPQAGALSPRFRAMRFRKPALVQVGQGVRWGRRRRRRRRRAAARKQKRQNKRAARKQKRQDKRAARQKRRQARKQKRQDKRAARKQKRKDKRAARQKRRQARKQKRQDKRAARKQKRQDKRAARAKRRQARKDRRQKRRQARKDRRQKRRQARKERRRKRRGKWEAKRKARAAADAKAKAEAAKKGAAAVKAEAATKAAAQAKRKAAWQAKRKAAAEKRRQQRADLAGEAKQKNEEIAREKAATPKVEDKAAPKQCHPKGPGANVCAVSGGGNVSPFDGAKMHRMGKIRSALLAKFLTKDKKFYWWAATKHMVREKSQDMRVQHLAFRCGNDVVRVTMNPRGGDLPRARVNGGASVRLEDDKPVQLPGAPKAQAASYFVRRTRLVQGKGQESLVEVEVDCGSKLPATTPYASGVRANIVWTGWESKASAADLRGEVRVMADARYRNLLKGQCRWGDVEAYPRWPADPPMEATPEFAGGAGETVECDSDSSESLGTSASVPVDGSSSSGAEATSAAMTACQKQVESCTGLSMGKTAAWFKRVDGSVQKALDDAVKGCAADKTAGQKVARPQVCAQVCGWVQDARVAVDMAIKDALDLAKTCEKAPQAERLLQRYAVERHELSGLCGGKADPALATPPKLPAGCKTAREQEADKADAARAADAKVASSPAAAKANAAVAAAGLPVPTTKAVLQTLTPGQVAALSPVQAAAVRAATESAAESSSEMSLNESPAAAASPSEESSEESSAAPLAPGLEAYPGLQQGQLLPCDYKNRDAVTDRLVPVPFEQNPARPVDPADFKTSCSRTTN